MQNDYASGGGFVAVNDEMHITASHQTTNGPGWQVHAQNTSAIFVTVETRVLCLKVSRGS